VDLRSFLKEDKRIVHKEKVMNARTLQELDGDQVFLIHYFLSAEECEHLIARGEAAGFQEAPITTAAGFVFDKEVRNNARLMVDDPALAAELWERARPFIPWQRGEWQAVGLNERLRCYRYDVGERFAPHYDGCFQRANGERSHLTFLVYLNDACEGGETRFYRDNRPCLEVHPACGQALVFVHEQLHEGAAVMRGRKYVLRTDVMYRRTAPSPSHRDINPTWRQ
jgi:predicted 2-oxoglutarate/Fe(II)-dependent dioxygenase YbiX